MATLSTAHDLACRLYRELESLKNNDELGDDTTESLSELEELADKIQSELFDLIETQL